MTNISRPTRRRCSSGPAWFPNRWDRACKDCKRGNASKGKLDSSKIPRFDDLVATMQAEYPDYLPRDSSEAESKLFDMLVEGNPQKMTHGESYKQALEHLIEQRQRTPGPITSRSGAI